MIKNVKVEGFKGASGQYNLGRLTLVCGPNGAGKSRVTDAIRFAQGAEVVGVGPEGPKLQQLMAGKGLAVEVVADRGTVRRSRDMTEKGTFGRSKVLVNGAEGQASTVLGTSAPMDGATFIGLSPEKSLETLAAIAAANGGDATVAGLLAGIDAVDPKVLAKVKRAGAPNDVLEAVAAAIKAEVKAAKDGLASAEKAADVSRVELGGAQVQAGDVERAKADAEKAREASKAANTALATIRAQVTAAASTIAELDREIAGLKAAQVPGAEVEDLAPLSAALAAAVEKREAAKAAEDAARTEAATASAVSERMNATYSEALARKAWLKGEIERIAAKAKMLETAPCRAATDWISAGDPFGEPADLCPTCPFVADVAGAPAALVSLNAQLAEVAAAVPGLEAADAEAHASAVAAQQRVHTTVAEHRAAHNDAHHEDRNLARAREHNDRLGAGNRLPALEAKLAEAREALTALIAQEEPAVEAVRVASAAESAAAATLQRVTTEGERLRRRQADLDRVKAAEARKELVAQFEAQVDVARNALRGIGEGKILDVARALVPEQWEVAFDGGLIGLRDRATGTFWAGIGLSEAQRAMLSLAADVALTEIAGATSRIVMVELDPIDLHNREALLASLEAAVERGQVEQVVACAWQGFTRPGWTVIDLGSDAAPAQPPKPVPVVAPAQAPVVAPAPVAAAEVAAVAAMAPADFADPFDLDADPFADPIGQVGLIFDAAPVSTVAEPAQAEPALHVANDFDYDPFADPFAEPARPLDLSFIDSIGKLLLRHVLVALGVPRPPRSEVDRRAMLREMAQAAGSIDAIKAAAEKADDDAVAGGTTGAAE